ncbi:hypothetical protein L227DRAFT_581910 [Lentinus tigrinus ALCF2SS1-6]|uniref:Uncharacterized protein n=1 Tax=Lentinus tigrinus ALCF2SS1-6 TaxID=1328759 RepID=A0A5C2RME7_9APHY|nr:hypothetical protein L227DRAFT_581910 [Lentinus tigrinus ALCF2SS1-6]
MHRRYGTNPAARDHATSSVSPQDSSSCHPPASSADPRAHLPRHLAHPAATTLTSGSGSSSSVSKLPLFSSGDGTPTSDSRIRTTNTPLTPPSLVESPQFVSPGEDEKHIPLSAATGLHPPSPTTSPPSQADSPPHLASHAGESSASLSSADEQLPTRASIRAWAKATPAGPPRNTPSPTSSAVLPQSSSDDNLDRQSITRSAGHQTVSSISASRSGSGSGTSSSDEDDSVGSGNLPFPEESSGNVADIESSGSGGEDASPQGTSDPSPSVSPLSRELLAPAPLHPPHGHGHAESSASESSSPAIMPTSAQVQEQQDRIDRRGDHHPPQHPGHSGRRRHRDRDRDRDRDHRERRSRPSNPTPPQPQPHPRRVQYPSSHTQSQGRVFPPLRIIPDIRLPPPPPPMRPLRPLQVSSGGVDVLEEMSRMLHYSRRPLIRTGVDSRTGPRRENDVLDDIAFMIQMSNGR